MDTNIIAERYSLLHKLGEGGMADVYLAVDTILNREVAVKILRGDLAHDPVAVLRFKREATAALALNHPNIVQVYDVGEENGMHYIVMEYIRGITLKQLIAKRGALDKQESVDIMKQLTSAMVHAHKNNVVHRDIKPQNVLIKDDGTVKLSDFGIALAQNAAQLTQADSVLGSVHYLAPELARGEAASEQSDIYALGIVFYEMLVGDVPFKGDTPVQIAMMHMKEDIPSIREFNNTIPQSIENVILIATAKNKNNRYRSCNAMYKDLETCLDESRADEAKVEFTTDNDSQPTEIFGFGNGEKDNEESDGKGHVIIEAALTFILMLFAGAAVIAVLVLTGIGPFKSEEVLVTIPDVIGFDQETAEKALTQLNLTILTVRTEWSAEYEEGKVIDIKEGVGNSVNEGSGVTLVVSSGKYYTVEDYSGKTIEDVTKICEQYGIKIKIQKEYTSEHEPGLVLGQSGLEPGKKIKPGTYNEIQLRVSFAAELVVPNVVGYDVSEAETMLKEQGFTVTKFKITPDTGGNVSDGETGEDGETSEEGVEGPTMEEQPEEFEGIDVNTSIVYGVVVQQNPSADTHLSATGSLTVELYYY